MAQLMKWDKARPADYYFKVTHLWLKNEDGSIEICERRQMTLRGDWVEGDENDKLPGIHADYWGEIAWTTDCRGYYSKGLGIVAAHVSLSGEETLINKLARKFQDAIYYCDYSND